MTEKRYSSALKQGWPRLKSPLRLVIQEVLLAVKSNTMAVGKTTRLPLHKPITNMKDLTVIDKGFLAIPKSEIGSLTTPSKTIGSLSRYRLDHRTRFGDWEGDNVHGKRGRSALITLVDRKSRYLLSECVTKVNSERVKQGMIDLFLTLSPKRVQSITPDRGTEFSQYKEIGEALDAKMSFPDPHAPQ